MQFIPFMVLTAVLINPATKIFRQNWEGARDGGGVDRHSVMYPCEQASSNLLLNYIWTNISRVFIRQKRSAMEKVAKIIVVYFDQLSGAARTQNFWAVSKHFYLCLTFFSFL